MKEKEKRSRAAGLRNESGRPAHSGEQSSAAVGNNLITNLDDTNEVEDDRLLIEPTQKKVECV